MSQVVLSGTLGALFRLFCDNFSLMKLSRNRTNPAPLEQRKVGTSDGSQERLQAR